MDREIKFKIWLPGIKKMSYEHTLEELMNWGTKEWTNGTAVFLQYTGLKDKNGREIYEGDFIRDRESFDEIYHYTVIWSESNTCFYFKDWFGTEHFGGEDIELTRAEVIGNIYENPELLEV